MSPNSQNFQAMDPSYNASRRLPNNSSKATDTSLEDALFSRTSGASFDKGIYSHALSRGGKNLRTSSTCISNKQVQDKQCRDVVPSSQSDLLRRCTTVSYKTTSWKCCPWLHHILSGEFISTALIIVLGILATFFKSPLKIAFLFLVFLGFRFDIPASAPLVTETLLVRFADALDANSHIFPGISDHQQRPFSAQQSLNNNAQYLFSSPPSPHKVITLGYLRMSGVDDSDILAGFIATIRDANIKNNAATSSSSAGVENRRSSPSSSTPPFLGFTIKLDVLTIACPDVIKCATSLASIDGNYVTPQIVGLANSYNKTLRDLYILDGAAEGEEWAFSNNSNNTHVMYTSAALVNATNLPSRDTDGEGMLLTFLARMPFYSAVMRPNYILAPRIIAHAKRLGEATVGMDTQDFFTRAPTTKASMSFSGGYIPIVGPITVAEDDYSAGSENLLHFDHYITNQLSHMFTFMQQSAGCAVSGVVYQEFSEMPRHVRYVQKMFTDGGMSEPPVLSLTGVTDESLLDFFLLDDPSRRCFVVLASNYQLTNVIDRLVKASNGTYRPRDNKFFGTMLLSAPRFLLANGDTSVFDVHFTRWSPQYVSTDAMYQVEAARTLDSVFLNWRNSSGVLNSSHQDAYNTSNFTASSFVSYAPIDVSGDGAVVAIGYDLSGFSTKYESIPTGPSDNMLAGHIMMSLVVETIRATVGKIGLRNVLPSQASEILHNYTSSSTQNSFSYYSDRVGVASDNSTLVFAAVIPYEDFIDTYFEEARTIGGYALYRLQRQCNPKPLPQVCYCNTAPRTSYIYYVDSTVNNNSMNGYPAVKYDDLSLGQKNVATLSFSASCSYESSAWSYPVSALFILPEITREVKVTTIFTETFGELTRAANYAGNAPARPFRFIPFTLEEGENTARVLETYTQSYEPFVVYGSLESNIASSPVLTLFPAIRFEMEDPILLPMENSKNTSSSSAISGFWQPNLLKLQPVLADYIHAIASYYDANAKTLFNDMPVYCIASTKREAELISLSFGTFGILVETKDIVVSSDPTVWKTLLTKWLSATHPKGHVISIREATSSLSNNNNVAEDSGYNGSAFAYRLPFVLAASTSNINNVIYAAVQAAKTVDRGILGLATGDAIMYNATVANIDIPTNKTQTTFANSKDGASESSLADVIFGGLAPEWWVRGSRRYQGIPASLDHHREHPRFVTALVAFEFAQTLAQSVQSDFLSSAADILYTTTPVIATRSGTFGPFSNESCTSTVIDSNSHDRQCQCTKGPRSSYIHSLKNREQLSNSLRTNRYSYTMATCGVVYTPYIPPPTPSGPLLSSSAIAGVAAGCSILLVSIITVAVLVNLLCFGRNNRAAPKDSSLPFGVVFTDIQSSTALWARAPVAMSEAIENHHQIIRKAIRRNDGYEVKTVGDSFMVAFIDIDNAVKFSLDVQIDLKDASCWGTEIDAIYLELIAEAETESASAVGEHNGEESNNNNSNNNNNNNYQSASDYAPSSRQQISAVFTNVNSNGVNKINNNNNFYYNDGNSSSGQSTGISTINNNNNLQNRVVYFNNGNPATASLYNQPPSVANSHFTAQSTAAQAYLNVPNNNNNTNTNNNTVLSNTYNPNLVGHNQQQQQQQSALHAFSNTLTSSGGNVHRVFSDNIRGRGALSFEACGNPNTFDMNTFVMPDVGVLSVHPPSVAAMEGQGNTSSSDVLGLGLSYSANQQQSPRGNNVAVGISHNNLVVVPSSVGNHQSDKNNNNNNTATLPSAVRSKCPSSVPNNATIASPSKAILVDALADFDVPQKSEISPTANTNNNNQFGHWGESDDANLPNRAPRSHLPHHQHHDRNHQGSIFTNNNTQITTTGTVVTQNPSDYTADSIGGKQWWHGLRVRIGVHYGMGDIRKDPVTLGYDYYGTVVNTAARVEGVGHGGQILITEDAHRALTNGFVAKQNGICISLGPQPLRGLDEPIRLHQLVPASLEGRRFPGLRLHIEKDTTDDTEFSETTTNTNTTSTGEKLSVEEMATRLCAGKQFQGISADNLLLQYYFFLATFAPTTEKYKAGVIAKLGEAWGFDKASKAAQVSNDVHRTRLLVGMLGKIIRTFRASRKVKGVRNFASSRGGGGGGSSCGAGRVGGAVGTDISSLKSTNTNTNPTRNHQHKHIAVESLRNGTSTSNGQEYNNGAATYSFSPSRPTTSSAHISYVGNQSQY